MQTPIQLLRRLTALALVAVFFAGSACAAPPQRRPNQLQTARPKSAPRTRRQRTSDRLGSVPTTSCWMCVRLKNLPAAIFLGPLTLPSTSSRGG